VSGHDLHQQLLGRIVPVRPDCRAAFINRRPAGGCVLLTLILEQVATRIRNTDQKLIDALLWGGVLKRAENGVRSGKP
jgi:hypothetical protein